MKLFKNVGIEDLESILEKGILSADEADNHNWEEGNRVPNPTDVVYLFEPIAKENSFANYGFVLLEVDVEGAIENELAHNDYNQARYKEFIIEKVAPEQITAIYVPAFLKERMEEYVSEETIQKMTFVEMYGERKDSKTYKVHPLTEKDLEQFSKTAELSMNAFYSYRYFQGVDEKNRLFEIFNLEYKISK